MVHHSYVNISLNKESAPNRQQAIFEISQNPVWHFQMHFIEWKYMDFD